MSEHRPVSCCVVSMSLRFFLQIVFVFFNELPLHSRGPRPSACLFLSTSATKKNLFFERRQEGEGARASTAQCRRQDWWLMALAEKATAKRDVGKVVARSMELVTGLENGATRKLDVDGKMSTWGASNSSSTHAQRWRRELGVEEWRPLRSLENQFAALMNDDKEGHNDTEAAASETVVPQEDNKRKSTVSRWKPQ